ncbi:hypothetical protein [Allokutzneria albata]|uniref:hypothetical protein n=1 Tax=Allokutzneria albata TaxID=211114 RepID=UPI0012DD4341|nr:hypothetical protein [Allokutzneria albata]
MQQAVQAYSLMWQDFAQAAATSDHHSSLLAQHASDQALRELRGMLFTNSIQGVFVLGRPAVTPRLLAVRVPELPIEVLLTDCHDDDAWPRYAFGGGTAPKPRSSGRRHINATVRVERDTWRVTGLVLAEPGTC